MGGGFGSDPFLSLHREMNRLFDDVFRGSTGQMPSSQGQGGEGGMLMPHIDVSETERELKICAELPGVSEKDIDVRLEDDVLVIRAEKKFERKDEKENYHFMERSYGTFQRAVRLPGPVDPDQVQASFDNGVLTVTVPKSEQQERSRRIQIQGGSRSGERQIEGETGKGPRPLRPRAASQGGAAATTATLPWVHGSPVDVTHCLPV
jgi:HSP20 family protein